MAALFLIKRRPQQRRSHNYDYKARVFESITRRRRSCGIFAIRFAVVCEAREPNVARD
jgi:hypothetical protein